MNYQLITTDTALETACKAASQASQIALDTEFVRIRTYYPHLGLIQMYDGKQISLIDPLAITNWTPFVELLTAPNIMTAGRLEGFVSSNDSDARIEAPPIPSPPVRAPKRTTLLPVPEAFARRMSSWRRTPTASALTSGLPW